jgi:lipopolysaccharide/colanic/teichoic acid biosynthesis glycosyltransferase
MMVGASEHKEQPAEQGARDAKRQALMRKRSIAIAVSLGLLVVLFYIVTLVKFGGALVEKTGS